MHRLRLSSRWALWVFAAALLLKSAMPFFAEASALRQGKALLEVCTVYGVALVAVGDEGHRHPAGPSPDHAGEHCVLNALGSLAGPMTVGAAVPTPLPAKAATRALPERPLANADASARWAARLRHGPPLLS